MPKINRYNRETHRFQWDEVSQEEHDAIMAERRAKRTGGRKPSKKAQAKAERAERLDEPATEPGPEQAEGPDRKGGAWHPRSFLAPALPDLVRVGVGALGRLTNGATRGKAPMRVREALVIAGRAARILDRKAAKYIRVEFKASEDGEDIAAILMALGVWGVAALAAVLFNRGPASQEQHPASQPGIGPGPTDIPESDIFAGSEPAIVTGNGRSTPSGAYPAPAVTPAQASDESDLFAGSEPLVPVAADTPAPPAPDPVQNGRLGRSGVSDETWALISPTDRGEALGL